MSVYFMLICTLVGGSLAIPTAILPLDTGGAPSPTNFNEFLKKFESTVFNDLKKLDDLGRSEFLSMADGVHFVVPLGQDDDLEQKYKTVSIAVSKLLRNLKTMERTSESITNVTRTLLSRGIKAQPINDTESLGRFLRTILQLYMGVMDYEFETDKKLAAEYKKQKLVAKQFVEHNREMGEPLIKVGDKYPFIKPDTEEELKDLLKNMNVLRECTLNQLFLGCSVDNFHHTSINTTYFYRQCYKFKKALMEVMAQSSEYESHVNEVYQKALAQTRIFVSLAGDDSADIIQRSSNGVKFMAYKNTSPALGEKLLKSIEKELALDPTLQKEIEVLMKKFEN